MNVEELLIKIEKLENKVKGLELDLDYLTEQNSNNAKMFKAIRELQETLKLKGDWFVNEL